MAASAARAQGPVTNPERPTASGPEQLAVSEMAVIGFNFRVSGFGIRV